MDRIKEAERRTEKIFETVLSAEFYQEQLPTMFSESKELFEEFLATEPTIADVTKILGGAGMDIAVGVFDNLKNGADLFSRFGDLSDEESRELGGILVDLTAIFLTAKVGIKEFKGWLSDRGKAKGAKGLVKVADKAEDAVSKVDDVADGYRSLKGTLKVIDGKVEGKIPVADYNLIRKKSVQNSDSDILTLGKYFSDDTSYTKRAGNTSYFDFGDDWGGIKNKYDLTDVEMFEYFNIPVLDDAVLNGKVIRFSHDPRLYETGFIVDEWEHIKLVLKLVDNDLIYEGGFWIVR